MLASQQNAITQINAMMDWREAQYRIARISQNRTRRRGIVNHMLDHADELMAYLSKHPSPYEFDDLSEAIGWFRREMKRQRGLAANSHWAFSNSILAACKDRLIVARYFRLLEASEALEAAQEREAA